MQSENAKIFLPIGSTWISANAGSGKTYNLVNRVIKLLVLGVEAKKILCITFTNSAADEMKIRLFDRLGEWVMMPEAELLVQIESLLGIELTNAKNKKNILLKARQLFAEALESQSALRISTIHSFCETVLRHFAFETDIPFDFSIIDEIKQKDFIEETLADLARERNQAFLDLNSLIRPGSENVVTELALDLINNRSQTKKNNFSEYFGDFVPESTKEPSCLDLSQELRKRISVEVFRSFKDAFMSGGIESQKYGKIIQECFISDEKDFFKSMEKVFLTEEKKLRDNKRFPEKKIKDTYPDLIQYIPVISNEILSIRNEYLVQDLYYKTEELKKFSSVLNARYEKKKLNKNGLDYDDLLEKTSALISRDGMVSWVKFKIDSAISHILVDESQDVSPIQWDIINQIAGEFFDDQSISNNSRSIFIVGDDKQSIYSFQGAVPEKFQEVRSFYSKRLRGVGSKLDESELRHSYRSSSIILNFVDKVFGNPTTLGIKKFSTHIGKKDLPGRIEIWPNFQKTKEKKELVAWWESFGSQHFLENEGSFAKEFAKEVSFIFKEAFIPEEHEDQIIFRKVEPKDILILFRSRGPLFYDILRELKRSGLPVMGADRFRLNDDIAIKDLMSVLKFLDNPLDDLSLAEALKSPIFNMDENTLFQISYNRPGTLWENCLKLIPNKNVTKELKLLNSKVDDLTVYQIIEFILVENEGIEKFVNRLGQEVKEVLEEFVSFIMAYEKNNISSISGFINWFFRNNIEVKRQTVSQINLIKVMTVHAAKGQESPIVILPDSMQHSTSINNSKIVKTKDSFFFRQDKNERATIISEIEDETKKNKQLEENRLLYVALTRAKYWLIICGQGKLTEDSWYQKCLSAYKEMSDAGSKNLNANISEKMILSTNWGDEAKKYLKYKHDYGSNNLGKIDLSLGALTSSSQQRIYPSNLGQDFHEISASIREEVPISDSENSLELGIFIHKLLESLSKVETSKRESTALNIANINFPSLNAHQVKTATEEVISLMQMEESKRFFSGSARFEVPIIGNLKGFGELSGKIDCLLINGGKVEIVDFKTDRRPPKIDKEVNPKYIMQIGAYAGIIQGIFPEHKVFSYLLWTKNKTLMSISKDLQKKFFVDFNLEAGNKSIL